MQLNQRDAILGKTALHICAERDDVDGCRILLASGADPKIKDKNDKQARGAKFLNHQISKVDFQIILTSN